MNLDELKEKYGEEAFSEAKKLIENAKWSERVAVAHIVACLEADKAHEAATDLLKSFLADSNYQTFKPGDTYTDFVGTKNSLVQIGINYGAIMQKWCIWAKDNITQVRESYPFNPKEPIDPNLVLWLQDILNDALLEYSKVTIGII